MKTAKIVVEGTACVRADTTTNQRGGRSQSMGEGLDRLHARSWGGRRLHGGAGGGYGTRMPWFHAFCPRIVALWHELLLGYPTIWHFRRIDAIPR